MSIEWIAELVGQGERALPNRDFLLGASFPDRGPRKVSRSHKMLLHIRGFSYKRKVQHSTARGSGYTFMSLILSERMRWRH